MVCGSGGWWYRLRNYIRCYELMLAAATTLATGERVGM